MNRIFKYLNYSKQSFHQRMDRNLLEKEQEYLLLPIITELRCEHPGVAARQLYLILNPEGIGRDRFEQLCFRNGFKLQRAKAFHRTTDSTGVIRFPNLVEGIELTGINQAWGSDITYYQIGRRFYYITFIIDLYSRMIVGYNVSSRLLTECTTLPALQMAIESRSPKPGLIFHSDGGGQYYCKAFTALTGKHKMKNSMSEMAYENPHAERVNGTIKNQYLKGYNPQSLQALIEMTARAVKNYNQIKPHSSLNKKAPAQYELMLTNVSSSSENDDFCNSFSQTEQNQKNHHSQMTVKRSSKEMKKRSTYFRH